MTSSNLTGKLHRWALTLQEYDFEVEYRPGSTNVVADALSRAPVASKVLAAIGRRRKTRRMATTVPTSDVACDDTATNDDGTVTEAEVTADPRISTAGDDLSTTRSGTTDGIDGTASEGVGCALAQDMRDQDELNVHNVVGDDEAAEVRPIVSNSTVAVNAMSPVNEELMVHDAMEVNNEAKQTKTSKDVKRGRKRSKKATAEIPITRPWTRAAKRLAEETQRRNEQGQDGVERSK
ncbi:hypothetical protein F442_20130 [Phytophthora nicotianae P10297]|uniref:Reverse transcriptase RNase H-like domain-containing protein n=1 Tax=Phytophthora nicotianae P10297 TaxID=1317064 RepID=W2Y8B2_PHYNI|nr:hypothetical protein F442_20130 [Phytophthora nicotianae P10297]